MNGWIWTLLKTAFWVALAYFCIRYFIPAWRRLDLGRRLPGLGVGWLLLAQALAVLHSLSVFGLWYMLLRRTGASPSLRGSFRAFVLSLLPKYVPGRLLTHGVRAKASLDAQIRGTAISASILWEAALGLASAGLVGSLGLVFGGLDTVPTQLRLIIPTLTLAVPIAAYVGARHVLPHRFRRWAGGVGLADAPGPVAAGVLIYGSAWLITGAANWCLIRSMGPVAPALFLPLTAALALAWAGGVVSLVAPAGLGVREGALYVLVTPWLGPADALLFVTLSRLLMFMSAVLLTAGWGAASVVGGRRAGREPHSGTATDPDPDSP